MERLLLAFALIGTTLACSPVPEPKVKGKGHDVVYVTLVTNKTYNPAGISTFLSDFSETKIQQYSASVGNFSDLNCTNTDGYFTWTFKLTDANCSIVKAWVNQIVNSSSFYQYGETSCSKAACSPVPEPKVKGKGNDIVYVILLTNQTYNPAGISTFLSDFSETKIQQYSASVGDFSDLNCTNTDGYFTWTFKLTDASCSIVDAWLEQIKESSSCYRSGFSGCLQTGTPTSANLIEITTPLPSTTTASPFVIVPGGALPVAPVVMPYELDYEETAERVQESVSSFESMSIMNL